MTFINVGKSTTDFIRCLKLTLGEFAEAFSLSEQAIKTIDEWLEKPKNNSLNGVLDSTQNSEIKWTGNKVDLIKIIYAAYKINLINDGQGGIRSITEEILPFFGQMYKKGDNTLSNNLKQVKWGAHPGNFFDKLKDSFKDYIKDPKCFNKK